MSAMGALLGLLISYLFRPTLLGYGPTLVEWYTKGWTQGYGGTIIICIVVGLLFGYLLGSVIDSKRMT